MDILETQINQLDNNSDLISFNSTTTTTNNTQATTVTNTNGISNHSLTSSGYVSGRSTPNTLLNRLNKLNQQQQQQLIPSIDDYLLDNELLMLSKQQQQMPKHQQQLQLLNDEIQNHLFYAANGQQQEQPISSSYRSLSLNNVILQSPTRQMNFHNNNNNNFDALIRQSSPAQYVNTNNNNNATVHSSNSSSLRRERSLDRSLSSSLLAQSSNRQRSMSVNKALQNNRLDENNLFKHDLSSNSIKALLQQQQTTNNSNKSTYSKEVQIKLIEMQKEINYLKCELELTSQKLQSSIQSVKTFWSPELKKERQARKDEAVKYQLLYEKYKILVTSSSYNSAGGNEAISMSSSPIGGTTSEDLQQSSISNLNKLLKENNLLKKTISEMEMRINTQKQLFSSKDETIKNLFMLLNSKDSQQQHLIDISNNLELSELKVCIFLVFRKFFLIKFLKNN